MVLVIGLADIGHQSGLGWHRAAVSKCRSYLPMQLISHSLMLPAKIKTQLARTHYLGSWSRSARVVIGLPGLLNRSILTCRDAPVAWLPVTLPTRPPKMFMNSCSICGSADDGLKEGSWDVLPPAGTRDVEAFAPAVLASGVDVLATWVTANSLGAKSPFKMSGNGDPLETSSRRDPLEIFW